MPDTQPSTRKRSTTFISNRIPETMPDLQPDVSIVVPLLNEAESLSELADQIRTACETATLSFEVWLIDDGSSDESWSVIRQLHSADSRFRGVRFRRNYGKSAALAVGFERVTGRYTITMDADLQDDPEEIPSLIAKLEEGFDLVSGWKRRRKDPLEKRVPSKFFNRVTRWVSGISLHDFNCGLKAYRTDVVKSIRLYGEMHRYIPLMAKWEGFTRITEIEVNHRARKFGKTKFGLERYFRGFLDLISVVFLTRFAARPMHFFGSIGFLGLLSGLLINGYLSILWFSGESIRSRPLFFLGLLLMLLGMQALVFGLLGEMLVKPGMEETGSYQISESL